MSRSFCKNVTVGDEGTPTLSSASRPGPTSGSLVHPCARSLSPPPPQPWACSRCKDDLSFLHTCSQVDTDMLTAQEGTKYRGALRAWVNSQAHIPPHGHGVVTSRLRPPLPITVPSHHQCQQCCFRELTHLLCSPD